MKTQATRRLSTIRLILAAVKDRDIAMRTEAGDHDDDAVITDILTKMIKQRRESVKMYEEGGRCELAEQELEEIRIIEGFLPRQLSDDEIDTACRNVVAEVGAEGLKDMGKAMGALKEKFQGQMDFAKAGAKMRALLS